MKNFFGFIKGLLACLAADAVLIAWFAAGVEIRSGNTLPGRLMVAALTAFCAACCGYLYYDEQRRSRRGRRFEKAGKPVLRNLYSQRHKKAG